MNGHHVAVVQAIPIWKRTTKYAKQTRKTKWPAAAAHLEMLEAWRQSLIQRQFFRRRLDIEVFTNSVHLGDDFKLFLERRHFGAHLAEEGQVLDELGHVSRVLVQLLGGALPTTAQPCIALPTQRSHQPRVTLSTKHSHAWQQQIIILQQKHHVFSCSLRHTVSTNYVTRS